MNLPIPVLLAALLTGGAAAEVPSAKHLTVHVADAGGDSLPGATVSLCPGRAPGAESKAEREACQVRITDAGGSVQFPRPVAGGFHVVVDCEVFASTAVYPLDFDPEAPREPPVHIEVLLNPQTIVEVVSALRLGPTGSDPRAAGLQGPAPSS
jgi:hypothetical protein